MDSKKWINDIREIKKHNDELFSLRNGHWRVKGKNGILLKFASSFYDSHLVLIKSISLKVLSEIHPMFELKPKERFAWAIYDKRPKYSTELRKGISETLVFLGIHSEKLNNCSLHKAEDIVCQTVRELFNNSTWELWASLNDVLPILAEATPDEFLTSVENTLKQNPCPFDELFKQEDGGVMGANYMTGLYWALETLAWSEEYLSRTILILAELAVHDPGGNWANRPSNSIITILLPWYPQTTASIEKRIASLKGIQKTFPDIAWKILINLLPNQHQTSINNPKPKFRNYISTDWKQEVPRIEYRQQVKEYASMTVSMVMNNINHIPELVDKLDNIPPPSYDIFLEYLSSDEIINLSDEQRLPIWEKLSSVARKHRCYPNTDWALPDEKIDLLERTAEKILPSSPEYSNRYLFSNENFYLLEKDEDEDWQVYEDKMQNKKIEALRQIYGIDRINSIIKFAKTTDNPEMVGYIFAYIACKENDLELLPAFFEFQEQFIKLFINSYISSRFFISGKMEWIESLHIDNWSSEQKCKLLLCLPFENEIWEKADELLGEHIENYWKKASSYPFRTQGNLFPAIEKLLKYNRPRYALSCIYAHYHSTKELFKEQAIKALISGTVSDEPIGSMDSYQIREIIKKLQEEHDIEENDLFKIEWAYLPLLDDHSNTKPILLEKHLSQNPDFFIEIIQLVYRSKKKNKSKEKTDKKTMNLANNAYKLLDNWKRPPGKMDDNSFSSEELKKWLNEVKAKTIESGHFEVAMIRLGHVLFYTEADPTGLWIQQSVAEILNNIDGEHIIQGFTSEVYNSRGVHYVDTSGKQEKELADLWRKRAADVENLGLIRFASALKELAHSYDREAERTISMHLAEQEEDNNNGENHD